VPHFTSVINWTLRLGLSLLQGVVPTDEPWVAIVDASIDVAIQKVLVVLRVPLSALTRRGAALTLEDAQCICVKVATTWTGETVCSALEEVFVESGRPVAILKDGGSDLKRGVTLLNNKGLGKTIQVIEDVGHVAGNAIKDEYGGQSALKDFISVICRGAAKLRQSELAFLTPPKLRSKGRFQGITKLSEWAGRILPLFGETGPAKPNSLAARLRVFFPQLCRFREFLERFSSTCDVARVFLEEMKNKGFSPSTSKKAEDILRTLPEASPFRQRMALWLQAQSACHESLGLGEEPMPVSSDILESLFGKVKAGIARNPKAEFNSIVLAIPALCGVISNEIIERALSDVSHRKLETWQAQNVRPSQWQARQAFHQGKLSPEMVPKTGEKFWEMAA
jgi:hypothetical protein